MFLISSIAYAKNVGLVHIREKTEERAESALRDKVQEINNSSRIQLIGGRECRSPKIMAVGAPKKSFRTNQLGDLETQWTSIIKVLCHHLSES